MASENPMSDSVPSQEDGTVHEREDAEDLSDRKDPPGNDAEDSEPADEAPPAPNDDAPADDAPVDDDRILPLTDKEWAEHVTEVRDTLDKARAAGLTTDRLYTIDPDHKEWNTDRPTPHEPQQQVRPDGSRGGATRESNSRAKQRTRSRPTTYQPVRTTTPRAESEDSNVQGELPGEAGAKSDADTEYGEVPPQETPPDESTDPHPTQESTPREESNEKDIDDAGHSRGDEHVDKAPDQKDLPDERRTSSTDSPDQKVPKPDDDPALADDRIGTSRRMDRASRRSTRRARSGRREGLISKRLHTIDGAGEIWTEERDRLHDSIIEDLYAKAAHVPSDFKAIIAGGLGGPARQRF